MQIRIKKRVLPESNYSAIYVDGSTIRIPLDPQKEITELQWPEFYDVGINTLCYGACPYCYTCAISTGKNFENVPEKIQSFFGSMTENQRPFQVALGGSGEPTLHPDFYEICRCFYQLGITPNYTTNGMHLNKKDVLEATKEFCGGVAVTIHSHLEKHWRKAIDSLSSEKVRLNVHYVFSDEKSICQLDNLYYELRNRVEYFVLLPLMPVGFAKGAEPVNYSALASWLKNVYSNQDIAFGSQAYEFLQKHLEYEVSLYPPEIMSKYLIMDDNMNLYNNSFEMKIWKRNSKIC
jgi:sulfatase maturation enzyme AslB (radical SAM superfamily)